MLAATPFVHETVDAAGGVGLTSLALDSQSRPHISYLNEGTGSLHYATKSGGVWARETVDAAGAGNFSNSLALDAEGNPRITYEEAGQLKYASKSGAVWTVETVDSGGLGVGSYSSLALDAQGNPCISYLKLIAFGSVHLKYATKSNGIWVTETVDATGDMFSSTSLALDALGNPHIAYHNQTPGDLKYAKKSGVSWNIETVDAAGHVGDHPSLALDAQGNPRISYWIDVAADLKYAAKSSNAVWSIEVVDASAGDMGFGSSLGLDAQGNPRIAYNEFSSGDLKYATKASGAWTLETVDINGGGDRSLALDAQGNPCISYSDGDLKFTDSAVHVLSPLGGERWAAGSLKTVRWSGAGTVSIQLSSDGGLSYSTLLSSITTHEVTITVPALTSEEARVRINRSSPISTSDSPRYFSIAPDLVSPWWSENVGGGQVSSLALDAQGKPHLSFGDAADDLKYARRSGSAWILETVDDVAGLSSLKLDSEGNPRISYDDLANGNLMYAAKSGGAWTVETVDGGGEFCSLALDAQGNPAISHYHLFLGDLKYARKSGGVWTLETVDATGDVGPFSSLVLDAQGNPRISYYFVTLGDLKYASKSGGIWALETVDSGGNVGGATSLALDAQGNPSISYYDVTNGNLKYARKAGGVWTLETVDTVGDVGEYTSLALDAEGNPSISYYDDTSDDLKVATKSSGAWTIELVDATGTIGSYNSLVVDGLGNARISYYDATQSQLKYASAAIEIADPAPGVVWPAGERRNVTWDGTGRVDLWLSVDGGVHFDPLASDLVGGTYALTVPETPSRSCRFRLERAVPRSADASGGDFAIVVDETPPAAASKLQLTLTGAAAGDQMGFAVSELGDVNGDGFDDVISGAYLNDAGGADAGRAYVYYGSPDADATADLTLTGAAAGDNFGIALAGAGDVNGDGFADIVVGAYLNDAGGADAGRAYVYYGGLTPDSTPDLTLTGAAAGDNLGGSVAGVGDVNGDGFDDLAVTAWHHDAGGANAGAAYVYYGGRAPDTSPDLTLIGAAAGDGFGNFVWSAGDVNGDHFADVIVGASANDAGGTNAGRAYVYFGGRIADSIADLILTGAAANDQFGTSVGSVGDMNGDGFSDLIVGSWLNDAGGNNAGRAYVYHGGPAADAIADLILTGAVAGDGFGVAVGGAGDVNRDGLGDFVVGAHNNDAGGANAGRAYIYYGGPGADTGPDITLTGAAAGDQFGFAVGAAGDLNGDGCADVIVGANLNDAGGANAGRSYLYDFNRYHVLSPGAGDTWNVGATQTISWLGAEPADLWLSVDGARSYELLLTALGGSGTNSVELRVPHAPTRYARLKLTPSDPATMGVAESESLFTIQSSVALLRLQAEPGEEGTRLEWSTEPGVGPEGLAGYRLYRLPPGGGGAGERIGPDLIVVTNYTDADAGVALGSPYRLMAVNGLGEELMLGETAPFPSAPLAAWPLPYRGGNLNVTFATVGGLGGGLGAAEVRIYDVAGRLVRTIAEGHYNAGVQITTWNGNNDQGQQVAAGIYFLRSRILGHEERLKLVVVR